jgi:hypothetical protein
VKIGRLFQRFKINVSQINILESSKACFLLGNKKVKTKEKTYLSIGGKEKE